MKKSYTLWLDGVSYGKGDWNYMQELMNEYVSTMDMYGNEGVSIQIQVNDNSIGNHSHSLGRVHTFKQGLSKLDFPTHLAPKPTLSSQVKDEK